MKFQLKKGMWSTKIYPGCTMQKKVFCHNPCMHQRHPPRMHACASSECDSNTSLQGRRLVTANVTISAVLKRPTHHGMGAYPRRCATTALMLGLNNCGPSSDGDVRPAFHSLQRCTYSCIWFEAACVSVRWRHSHWFRFLCNGTSCLLSIVDRIELFCNQVVFR